MQDISIKQLCGACLVILERKSMPLCSSSTLMGASVFALSTSFVFFACGIDHTVLYLHNGHCSTPTVFSKQSRWVEPYAWHSIVSEGAHEHIQPLMLDSTEDGSREGKRYC